MNLNLSENENLSDYEPISNMEAFDSLFNNQDSLLYQVNQSIDNKIIIYQDNSNEEEQPLKKSCNCDFKILYNKVSDFVIFLILFLNTIYDLVSTIINIFEFAISTYSVILLNYVFFIASIVSYSMSPIYKILSGQWLNFVFSFAQVILASPLIGENIFW